MILDLTLNKCLVIAEVAQTHDGSLGIAHALIDAVSKSGADAIKFQTHIAKAESTISEPWRVKFSKQDVTRYEYWRRMEFTEEQWHGLKGHADQKKLLFLSSPFSVEAAELLKRVGVAAWKIPSGEISNILLFENISETGLPILLSTGMSSIDEIDKAVEMIKAKDLPLVIMQCTSMYPTPPEKIGINLISYYQSRYNIPTGISDHSGTIYPALAAATMGAAIIEVHVTFSKQMFGPDVPSSVTIDELEQLVKGVRFIEKMRDNPIDKNKMAEELDFMRDLFTKSVVLRTDLSEGAILTKAHLTIKKPGTGIPASCLEDIIGRKLSKAVSADALLSMDDLVEI